MRLLVMGSLIALGACASASRHVNAEGSSALAKHKQAPPPTVRISTWTSPTGQVHEVAIWRPAPTASEPIASASPPSIERVYVVPGSGCTGMAPILAHYFEGLKAREFIVLHKLHVHAADWPRPTPCRPGFVAQDELASWSLAWRSFMDQDLRERPVPLARVVLVGISEGAELLPGLMANWPDVGLSVLLGSTGLDPWDALLMQLQREHDPLFAGSLQARLDAPSGDAAKHAPANEASPSDERLVGGRTLSYWRTLRHWPMAVPLGTSRTPTLVLMGDADGVQATEGLTRFAQEQHRPWLCTRLVPGADHGLRIEATQWRGLWPLVQGLVQAPTAQAFERRCAQPD
jgi:hypothetical protein